MNKSLLVTRPNHDITVNYLFFWCNPILDLAKMKNFAIHDLSAKKAEIKEFESHMRARKPALLFLNGHGTESSITGQDNKPIIGMNVDEDVIKDSIIYARSCRAAKQLGPLLIRKKAKAFMGYKRDFVFMYQSDHVTKPLQDKIARLFLNPSNLGVRVIIKGHPVKEAFYRSQRLLHKNLMRSLSSAASKEENDAAPSLLWNLNSKVLIGDKNASIN